MSNSIMFVRNENLDLSNEDNLEQIEICAQHLFALFLNNELTDWEGTDIEDVLWEMDQLGITTIIGD